MFEEQKYNFTDLMDLKKLQEIQDSFALFVKMASVSVDETGQLTKPSNFSEFCKLTRSSKKGGQLCNGCDIQAGKTAAESGKPYIYTCHAGLTDFAVPVFVENNHIGTILGGQIVVDKPLEQKIKEKARELGIDEKIYLDAFREIKAVTLEDVQAAANLLSTFANTISEISLKNFKLQDQYRKEKHYTKAMTAIRKILDVGELKQAIVNIVGEALKADRCFIVEYDEKHDKFTLPMAQYLPEKIHERYISSSINEDFPNFFNLLKKGKPIILNCRDFVKNETNPIFDIEKKVINDYNIKSIFVVPMFYQGKLLGVLSSHFEDENRQISKEEFQYVNTVANHVAIAFHQARLYELTQAQAQREKINRNIIEIVRSTIEKKSVKNLFVNTLGEYLNADVVFFSEYNEYEKVYEVFDEYSIFSKEALPEPSVLYKNMDEPSDFKVLGCDGQPMVYEMSGELKVFIKNLKVESYCSFPVYYHDKFMGFFYIGFNEKTVLGEADKDLVKNICKQTAVGLYQAELYLKAQEASIAKSNFIANMSHEIKTPLNIIIGFSDILSSNEYDRKKQIHYLKSINQSGRYLSDLTDGILSLSKIDSGTIELSCSEINIESLIKEIVNSVMVLDKEKVLNFEIDVKRANIWADKKIITQILYNLLSNAIKFTPNGGMVRISSCFDGEDNILISVQDSGIGINERNQEIIFEPFKQLNQSLHSNIDGSGLGLSITKRLVELHNGKIYVNSKEGVGSTFWFTIPIKAKMFVTQNDIKNDALTT